MQFFKRIKNWLTKELFNTITEDDVLFYSKGKFYVGELELPPQDVRTIVAEAIALKDMYLMKLLLNSLKHTANERVFKKSKNWEDVTFGKAMLYCVDILEKKIDNLSKVEPPPFKAEPK